METGELFRITNGTKAQNEMIFRVENSLEMGCQRCAGYDGSKNNTLCKKLPTCIDTSGTSHPFVYVKLNSNEIKRALKQKITINQYPNENNH